MSFRANSYDNKHSGNKTKQNQNPNPNTNPPSFLDKIDELSSDLQGLSLSYDHEDFGYNIGKRDYLGDDYDYASPYNPDYTRGENQSNFVKGASGVGRALAKTGLEVAKLPGIFGGILAGTAGQTADWLTGEDNTDFAETAFNNSWINAIEHFEEETIKEDLLPVYTKRSYEEGGIFNAVTSMDFYATEGADGLGFMASMMFPGAGLKVLGAGRGLANLTSKAGRAVSGFAKGVDKADEAYKTSSKIFNKIGKALPMNEKSANVFNATVVNTTAEAGVETASFLDRFNLGKDEFIEKRINELRIEEAEKLATLREQGITEEEIEKNLLNAAEYDFINRRSEGAAKIFGGNAAVLLLPNYVQNKFMYKAFGKKADDVFNPSDFIDDSGKFMTEAVKKTAKDKALRGLKLASGQIVNEGLIEEGSQMTMEEVFFDQAMNNESWTEMPDLVGGYIDMISSVDGQKAVYLGGLLGTGMSVIQGRRESKHLETMRQKLSKTFSDQTDLMSISFNNLFETDENGKLVTQKDEEGKDVEIDGETQYVVKNMEAMKYAHDLQNLAKNLHVIEIHENTNEEDLSREELAAYKVAQKMKSDFQDKMLTDYISNFAKQGKVGLEVLKNKLEKDSELRDKLKEGNSLIGKEKEADKVVEEIMNEATNMMEDINLREDYFKSGLKIKSDVLSRSEKEFAKKNWFDQYLKLRSRKRLISNRLKESEEKYAKLEGAEDNELILSQYDELMENYESLESEINELNKSKESIPSDIKSIEDSFNKKKEEAISLNKSLKKINGDLKKLDKSKKVKEEREGLESSKKEIKEKLEKARKERNEENKKLSEAKSKKSKNEKDLKSKLDEFNKITEEVNKKGENLDDELSFQKRLIDAHKSDIENLTKDYNAKYKDKESFNKYIKDLEYFSKMQKEAQKEAERIKKEIEEEKRKKDIAESQLEDNASNLKNEAEESEGNESENSPGDLDSTPRVKISDALLEWLKGIITEDVGNEFIEELSEEMLNAPFVKNIPEDLEKEGATSMSLTKTKEGEILAQFLKINEEGIIEKRMGSYIITNKEESQSTQESQTNNETDNNQSSSGNKVSKAYKEVKEKLKALNKKKFKVNPNDNNSYIEVDEKGNVIGSKLYKRASYKEGKSFSNNEAADRGTIIDEMLRAYISKDIKSLDDLKKFYEKIDKGESNKFSENFINDLYNVFQEISKETPNFEIISDISTLWGNINGEDFAGTIDLLAVNKDNGKVYIIDLKTSTLNRRDQYKKTSSLYDYKGSDSVQQSRYAEMLAQQTGVVVSGILILPIQVNKGDYYSKAFINKEESSGKITLSAQTDSSIFDPSKHLKETTAQSTKAKKAEIEISEKEYNDFIDKGVVTSQRINSIAQKIKNNENLSKKEIAIFNDKTSEINDRLTELKALEESTSTQSTQSTEAKEDEIESIDITPLQISNILNSKNPTQPKINRILGLDLMDETAIILLEQLGIISKREGAKPRTFLKNLGESLNLLEELKALKEQSSNTNSNKSKENPVDDSKRTTNEIDRNAKVLNIDDHQIVKKGEDSYSVYTPKGYLISENKTLDESLFLVRESSIAISKFGEKSNTKPSKKEPIGIKNDSKEELFTSSSDESSYSNNENFQTSLDYSKKEENNLSGMGPVHSKVVVSDIYTDNLAREYMENGESKIGDKVSLSLFYNIDESDPNNQGAIKALNLLKSKKTLSVDEKNFILVNLILNVKFKNGGNTILEYGNYSLKNKATRELKANFLERYLNGDTQVNSTITFQKGGSINLANEDGSIRGRGEKLFKPAENRIFDSEGNSNIRSNDFKISNTKVYFSNEKNKLEDIEGVSLDEFKSKHKGQIFILTKKANGEVFPLKLNQRRLNRNESELLFSIIKEIAYNKDAYDLSFENSIKKGIFTKIQEDLISQELKDLNLDKKTPIGKIITFFAHKGKVGTGSYIKIGGLGNENKVSFSNKLNIDATNLDKNKETVIDHLMKTKNRQVSKAGMKNESYKKRVFRDILTTDININKDQGNSFINAGVYIDSKLENETDIKSKKESTVKKPSTIELTKKSNIKGLKGVSSTLNNKGRKTSSSNIKNIKIDNSSDSVDKNCN